MVCIRQCHWYGTIGQHSIIVDMHKKQLELTSIQYVTIFACTLALFPWAVLKYIRIRNHLLDTQRQA
jgi:hypothetical protein